MSEGKEDEEADGEQVLLDETRRISDNLIREVDKIDDKAERMARISILLLGAVGSAVSLPILSLTAGPVLKLGVVLIGLSLGASMLTYTTSRIPLGVRPEKRLDMDLDDLPPDDGDKVRRAIIAEYPDIFLEIEESLRADSFFLTTSQVLFFLGSAVLLAAIFL